MDVIFQLGGVPSSEQYRDLTESQWSILIHHMQNRDEKMYKKMTSLIEYLALLVSPFPKEAAEAIKRRHKEEESLENMKESTSEGFKQELAPDGTNQKGVHVSTEFADMIKEVGGENAVKQIFGDDVPEYKPLDESLSDEDKAFIENAQKEAMMRMAQNQEEDSIII